MSLQQETDIYPVTLNDNDWAQILKNNREAQDLLSTAIAHHEQHREEDPIKRKGAISEAYSKSELNNRLTSNDELSGEQLSGDDNSSDDGHSPGEGKPAPKKAGRKPLTTEPTNKRKAQNRAAQRAFRDRKERYVKSLEDRIKELEELNPGKTDNKLAEENLNLKVLVQKLETENYFLKEQSFTFDFPISQPGLYNVNKSIRDNAPNSTQDQSNANTNQSTQSPSTQSVDSASTPSPAALHKPFPAGNVAKPLAYSQLPWSPPSSVGDSVPNSPLENDRSTPEQESVVPRIRNSTPEEIALFSSILDGNGNTALVNMADMSNPNLYSGINQAGQLNQSSTLSMSSVSPANTFTGLSEHSPSPTLDDLVNTPLFSTNDGNLQFQATTSGLSMPALTFEQTQALFTNFRETTDSRDIFASLDDPIDTTTFSDDTMGGLFNDQLIDFGAFGGFSGLPTSSDTSAAIVPSPAFDKSSAAVTKDSSGATIHSLLPLAENEKAIPCPQVWEHIAKHPNFDDADIDELCTELKAKAKCSGHGPVISLSDVDTLMNKLNQE
ncbi:DNA-binding transcription factor yap1 [Entomortierella beljakovae]|nr:DNA-binding transcription factor yap1 [Entomortierella beljakovae]